MHCFVIVLFCLFINRSIATPVRQFEKIRNDVDRVRNIRENIVHDVSTFIQKKSTHVQGEMTTKCSACIFLVNYEKMRLEEDPSSMEELGEMVEKGCEYFRIETPRICKGAYSIFGPEATSVLTQVDLSAESICGICLPYFCPDIPDARNSGNRSDWLVSLPPLRRKRTWKSNIMEIPTKTLKILHLSDVHIDLQYKVGSNAVCNEPLCCRSQGGDKVPTIIDPIRGEAPMTKKINETNKAWKWGDYRTCDLPWWTVNDVLQKLSKTNQEEPFDYILWTGDVPAHDVWSQNRLNQLYMLHNITSLLVQYFPNTPVFPAVGNHDSFPSNNFPPASVNTGAAYSAQWFYNALWKAWSVWLPSSTKETIELGGFYSTLVKPGFRIVSLNTNFCYTENWWVWLDPVDPSGMLQWFVKVLTSAEMSGEKVQVIGHVPPGKQPDCIESWSFNYIRILERFQHIITAQFFGHTHNDEIELIYNEDGTPMSVAYIAPSLTSYIFMKPAYRVYDVDGYHANTTWSVTNHRTYTLDLKKAHQTNKPNWLLEYDACDAYNQSYLSADNWGDMIGQWEKFLTNKHATQVPQSLAAYVKHYVRHPTFSPLEGLGKQLHCHDIDCYKVVVCDIIMNKQSNACLVNNVKDKTKTFKKYSKVL
uniref:sphingomyelin phosphodiesterase-like n=1 Tax=Ciona intestinalis TaxID=7719 RepID=UPI0002B8D916|nr:sphingomyelin phosphodiesterase-like [Ciona intestinalis]|eukprot:XP_002130732.2 sphingomyelin phosphodiesterase-like [Ciona intestinalis]